MISIPWYMKRPSVYNSNYYLKRFIKFPVIEGNNDVNQIAKYSGAE